MGSTQPPSMLIRLSGEPATTAGAPRYRYLLTKLTPSPVAAP